MEQNQFDKQIKQSLENLEAPFNEDHWAQMEQQLDSISAIEDTTAFDSLISGKLENIKTDAAMPNWQRMAAALDQVEIEGKNFDTEVKTKINFINPTYQPSHWEMLAARLRQEKAVKESLIKNKSAEVILIALLFLNFYQFFPNFPQVSSFPAKEVIEEVPAKEAALLEAPQASTTNVQKNQPIVTVGQSVTDKEDSTIDKNVDNQLYFSPALTTVDISGGAIDYDLKALTFGIDGETGLTITVPEMTRHLNLVGLANSIFLESLPSLEPASLATTNILPLDCENCTRYKMYSRLRFGMVSHIGGTSAVRSADQFLSTSVLTQKGAGYGSGFSLGFKYNRYEIETGLIYSAKTYAPNIDDAYSSYGGGINLKQFTGINLQTLQIPLNLRYNYAVLGKGKLHLYAQNGVAMNIVLRAQYDITDKRQPTTKQFNEIAGSSRLSKIRFNKGILGGDSFKENRFFTVNLGVGAEYYMSPKWSVFMQPDFHYYISQSRIGPTKDRINSLSVSFGIKTSFH